MTYGSAGARATCDYVMQELVSDVITQQTRLVGDALNGINNGWNEAIKQLLSPSPCADTISSDQVQSLIKQFQPIPDIHRPVDTLILRCLRSSTRTTDLHISNLDAVPPCLLYTSDAADE